MSEVERACAYLEAMAEKVGGDVKVFRNDRGAYIMQRSDALGAGAMSFRVKLDEPREKFNRKVQRLMEGV